jgi:hypothetical protein
MTLQFHLRPVRRASAEILDLAQDLVHAEGVAPKAAISRAKKSAHGVEVGMATGPPKGEGRRRKRQAHFTAGVEQLTRRVQGNGQVLKARLPRGKALGQEGIHCSHGRVEVL